MVLHRVTLAIVSVSMFVVCGQWAGQAAAQVNIDVGGVHVQVGDGQPPPPPAGVEVLTRGPVHEAFAQPVTFDEGAGFMIPFKPPAPIDEVPPDVRPEGEHIVWIPGYWSWDVDRNDFIWVSGCWRAVPPNTGWVPGYWAQSKEGYQWIAGFWDTADNEEIEYLPAPPATLEEGPQGAVPADSVWIPGCWVRHEGRYAWRPGFWEQARPNWVWAPAYYVVTPRGYVYVDGYWDYTLDHRGVAFLPVYYPPTVYRRAGVRYSPDIALDLDGLTLNLFISPQRHQYYFGDYYGPEYARQDFHPWYEVREHHDWYDPIFVHQQWQHRDDPKWADNQRTEYDHRRDDKTLRPARTYEAMKTHVASLPEKDRRQAQVARPMKELVAAKATPFKFAAVDAKTREATANQAKDVHAYKDKRAQWEAPAAKPRGGQEPTRVVVPPQEPAHTTPRELPKEPPKVIVPPERPQTPDHGAAVKEPAGGERVKIPRPPVSIREPLRDKELTPPPRPKQPNPDLNAKPRPSKPADTPDRSKQTDSSGKDKPDKDKTDSKRE